MPLVLKTFKKSRRRGEKLDPHTTCIFSLFAIFQSLNYILSLLSDFLICLHIFISDVTVERTPQTHRRPLTVVMCLKTPNLTTRPIRALLKLSQPPRTGVYDRQVKVISHILLVFAAGPMTVLHTLDRICLGCAEE